MKNAVFALAFASILGLATPVLGQTTPQSAAATPRAGDAGEVVCKKEEVVGSRLATRRVCLTRLQWAERKSEDRKDLEAAQHGACLAAPGKTSC